MRFDPRPYIEAAGYVADDVEIHRERLICWQPNKKGVTQQTLTRRFADKPVFCAGFGYSPERGQHYIVIRWDTDVLIRAACELGGQIA